MKKPMVKELMVPLSEYATVSKDASLYDAVLALEQAIALFDPIRHRHQAILVFDEKEHIVGKLSQFDILQVLSSGDQEVLHGKSLTSLGLSPMYDKTAKEEYREWNRPLNDLCRKAAEIKVETFMQIPTEGEYVSEDTTLNQAIRQLIQGQHRSLLVTRGKEIVGILRLTDVFREVIRHIKECK